MVKNGSGRGFSEDLRMKLEICQKGLTNWEKNHSRVEQQKTTRMWAKISHLQDNGDREHIDAMKQMQEKAEKSLAETNMKWRQRAKQHWLRKGDRNTTYFHMQPKKKDKCYHIHK
ncbi:uncharacterized protein LOC122281341 [Carya illinoinensis]|uniref:uncharacterized protein LOC122281341 n=1 Tax=Carya illinoinensis TaxID=32201 RepID=UPI001C718E08|nr:uncharacterized protein LOC122281341 [Carya illinoinensis]